MSQCHTQHTGRLNAISFWLRQEPKVLRCCLSVRACVWDIIQMSSLKEFLRVLKSLRESLREGLREGLRRGPREGGLKRGPKERA